LPDTAPFVVELTASDTNLACETLVVDWTGGEKPPAGPLFTAKELTAEKIETKLGVFVPRKEPGASGNKLRIVLDWTPARDVPPRVNIGAAVKDKAGNSYATWQTNIGTDLTAPAAKVIGVRGLPGR
jgi:hypothetical protein